MNSESTAVQVSDITVRHLFRVKLHVSIQTELHHSDGRKWIAAGIASTMNKEKTDTKSIKAYFIVEEPPTEVRLLPAEKHYVSGYDMKWEDKKNPR
jgi:hypothetical protein